MGTKQRKGSYFPYFRAFLHFHVVNFKGTAGDNGDKWHILENLKLSANSLCFQIFREKYSPPPRLTWGSLLLLLFLPVPGIPGLWSGTSNPGIPF